MKKPRFTLSNGIPFGMISAIAFGTSPFFARNLFASGFTVDGVLFFRFLPALLVLAGMTFFRGNGFCLSRHEALQTLIAGVFFCATSFLLFLSYRDMDVGIAATLLFLYPIFVVIISALLFQERLTCRVCFALTTAFAGVALLSISGNGNAVSLSGISLALLSAVSYAGYQVWTARSCTRQIPAAKLTFYLVLLCFLFYAVRTKFGMALPGEFSLAAWGNIIGVSMIGALLAMGFSAVSLQRCGATMTSVLGALEPLTAVLLGILFFQESFTWQKICGILLVITAVLGIILQRRKKEK